MGSRRWALGSVLLIWALARLYPLAQIEPPVSFEVWQAHKLLDYGFWARHGAMIIGLPEKGLISNPAPFNYAHHPYPYQWLCTLLYAAVGPLGLCLTAFVAHIGICAAVFLGLERFFGRFSAWCGTLVYALAPILVYMEGNNPTHSAVLCASLAPLGVLALGVRREGVPVLAGMRRWWPGILVFIMGQMDWYALVIAPTLLVLCQPWTGKWRQDLKALLANPVAWGIVAGAVLTAAVFLGQAVLYEPDLGAVQKYLVHETGGGQAEHSRWALLFLYFPLRVLLFAGVVLLAGALVGLFYCRRDPNPLVLAALANLACLGLMVAAMPMYFYKENSLFPAFLFPLAVLTALAVHHRPRVLPWLLLVACIPGLLEAQLYASVTWFSPPARKVAEFLVAHTAKSELILTNLQVGRPPFDASDAYGETATRLAADRMLSFGCLKAQDMVTIAAALKHVHVPTLYLLAKSRPLDPEFLRQVQQQGKLVASQTLVFPEHQRSLAERLKGFMYYEVMHKKTGPPVADTRAMREETFELYRLADL